jgi:hypothetical protein
MPSTNLRLAYRRQRTHVGVAFIPRCLMKESLLFWHECSTGIVVISSSTIPTGRHLLPHSVLRRPPHTSLLTFLPLIHSHDFFRRPVAGRFLAGSGAPFYPSQFAVAAKAAASSAALRALRRSSRRTARCFSSANHASEPKGGEASAGLVGLASHAGGYAGPGRGLRRRCGAGRKLGVETPNGWRTDVAVGVLG